MGKHQAEEPSALYGRQAAVAVMFASADTPNGTGPGWSGGPCGPGRYGKGGSAYRRPDSMTPLPGLLSGMVTAGLRRRPRSSSPT